MQRCLARFVLLARPDREQIEARHERRDEEPNEDENAPEYGLDMAICTAVSLATTAGSKLEVGLMLTGACGPRGTAKNIALGERRASTVRDYLRALGLNSSRISITSVGEEMATGTDEASWARDRHVAASAERSPPQPEPCTWAPASGEAGHPDSAGECS